MKHATEKTGSRPDRWMSLFVLIAAIAVLPGCVYTMANPPFPPADPPILNSGFRINSEPGRQMGLNPESRQIEGRLGVR